MKKLITTWLLLIGSVLPAFAVTMYTSDITAINVRQNSDAKSPIVKTLKSGEAVVVLESAQGWTKIQLSDGKQGWLVSSYLTDEIPATVQAPQVNKKIEQITQQLDAALKENEALKKENQTVKSQLEDNMKKLRDAVSVNRANPDASEELSTLKANLEQVSADAALKTKKIEKLEQELANTDKVKGNYNFYLYMFLAGAGVLLLGLMIGASSKRRRSSLL